MQERPPFGAVFCGIKQCALALGFFLERCRRQRKREKKGAAVEILRRSTAEFREPQGAAMPKMPGVRITSLRPYRKDRLSGRSFAVLSNVRLLWAFFSSAAGGRESERKKAQRSKFCGAAQQNFGNRKGRRCRRCRVFESPHSDQIERPPFGAVFCDIKQTV